MAPVSSLLHDHIDFTDLDLELNEEQKRIRLLTFMGASAISLLCYEETSDLSHVFRQDNRFKLVRDQGIISDVWSLADVTSPFQRKPGGTGNTAPLLGWSTRLGMLFVGFRGTHVAIDILTNLNIHQKAASDLGTQFHAGFCARAMPYTNLIEQLAQQHKLVVCGHSLGGAIATIAAYEVLAQGHHFSAMPNTWNQNDLGLSVVTFGSPSAMVLEKVESTAAPRHGLRRNFHHIVNPEDYVPFILNDTEKAFLAFSQAVTFAPAISVVWKTVLKFWESTRGNFAHFGCIFLLKVQQPTRYLRQITVSTDIPERPRFIHITRYHSMEHYNSCVRNLDDLQAALGTSYSPYAGALERIDTEILSLASSMGECSATICDSEVTMALTMTSRLSEFLVKSVSFEHEGTQIPVSSFAFMAKTDDPEKMTLVIKHDLSPERNPGAAEQIAYAMKRGLRVYDSLNRHYEVQVNEIQVKTLKDANLPTTFASIRLAMILAFSEQISSIGNFNSAGNISCAESVTLSETTSNGRILALPPNEDSSAGIAERLESLNIFNVTEDMSGAYKDESLSQFIPRGCTGGMRILLSAMLKVLEQGKVTPFRLSVEDWKQQRYPTLKDVFPGLPSFAGALKNFSYHLLKRSTDPQERIRQAIRESDEVLRCMKFCYIVIITQLDPSPDWYCTSSETYPKTSAALGSISWLFSAFSIWGWTAPTALEGFAAFAAAFGLAALATAVGGAIFGIAVAGSTMAFLTTREQLLQFRFASTVLMSMQALRIPSSVEHTGEILIKKFLENDAKYSSKITLRDLEKLQDRLKNGLKCHPEIKPDWEIRPTIFWAKWLFSVAGIGELQESLSEKTRIGVLGPTEAGKSALLTTLTGAAEDVFRPGSCAHDRTMELQSFPSTNREAIFLDCPGSNDLDQHIREVARLFHGIFGITIFVVPMEHVRSQSIQNILTEIAIFLGDPRDFRPVRILLSKVDQLDYNRKNDAGFRKAVQETRRTFLEELKRVGSFKDDFAILSRQVRGKLILLTPETLEDITKPYSTYAQMTLDGRKALSDCDDPQRIDRKIESFAQFRTLHGMAENGEIWDVESLRQWLRGLSPNCVPSSLGRVFQES
ncbi:hypothetical protein VTL71DRAFT_14147 [Oculimacula yallundae]|uniref:Fungal lipase-type domain-containing protein n=1 Tax=Oculimacula yallundae TaxID=86028 RepID=A0ABR4CHM6_9HELO